MASQTISHALVLPDRDFAAWVKAAEAYGKTFPRVAVVRSPSGNDLNRFRNVSAVQTPGVWFQDNALAHIRRVYPMVVVVDVIRAAAPADLARIFQERVRLNDRYGERTNEGAHLFERFTIEWPSDARPARIVRTFNEDVGGRKHEGIDINAPQGTTIRAAASGSVATVVRQSTALGYGQYVQIATALGGENYLTTYALLRDIAVNVGQVVKTGDMIGKSNQDQIKVVVQQPGKGLGGYLLPSVVDPIPLIYWPGMRLKTTATGLRLRERPGTEFKVLAMLRPSDRIETLEMHGRTLLKLGKPNEWLKVRSPQGVEGFAAAEFLVADESEGVKALNLTGVNLDIRHRLGKPGPERLKGLGWVRFPYNVSMDRGSTDLEAAHNLYAPFIERYAKAGLKIIVVLTHQTYGEGQGYVWPEMNTGKWRELTARFADFANKIARRYAGRDQVAVYQVWNEQDTVGVGGSAVSMPPADYGYLLAESIKALRAADTKATIITGGHISGAGRGANYARAALAAMPTSIRPDGLACHPYGRGPVDSIYSPFGSIDEEIDAFSKVMPGAPVWITEWGVLDRPNDPPAQVADYAVRFVDRIKRLYSGKVATAVWYAWADTMHNGYGLVDAQDRPRQPLYDRFFQA